MPEMDYDLSSYEIQLPQSSHDTFYGTGGPRDFHGSNASAYRTSLNTNQPSSDGGVTPTGTINYSTPEQYNSNYPPAALQHSPDRPSHPMNSPLDAASRKLPFTPTDIQPPCTTLSMTGSPSPFDQLGSQSQNPSIPSSATTPSSGSQQSPLPSSAFATSSASAGIPFASMPSGSPANNTEDIVHFPWQDIEVTAHSMKCEGRDVTPEIHATVVKGFFHDKKGSDWTCYRRNYFAVKCNYYLHNSVNNGQLFLQTDAQVRQVKAMGMRLIAAVDGSNGKNIELVQHTPKRDNGPKSSIKIVKLSPTPSNSHFATHVGFHHPATPFHTPSHSLGPMLPLQCVPDQSSPGPRDVSNTPLAASYPYPSHTMPQASLPGQDTSHTFDRIQFKHATANNGKRRATQQYFHLLVELYADVRDDAAAGPEWVRVAFRISEKVVVRGRSPSHYKSDGRHSNGRSGSGAGGGGAGGYSLGPGNGPRGNHLAVTISPSSTASSVGHSQAYQSQAHQSIASIPTSQHTTYMNPPTLTEISRLSYHVPSGCYNLSDNEVQPLRIEAPRGLPSFPTEMVGNLFRQCAPAKVDLANPPCQPIWSVQTTPRFSIMGMNRPFHRTELPALYPN